jgi:hypothetical protein
VRKRSRTLATTSLRDFGIARRKPLDRNVPAIGAELATSRALSDLAHKLPEAVEELVAVT